ncbi:hypothetical protein M899_1382 [Bacteriovorax sp. BSW11_IV]|uniref:hypothetical protein n=1 Tax=Bacteriovorax sp. BSW11_IV TaxID=1353529 RepID=UPI00038A5455|nr:hypothetical protein [Bacteriovorax sp. BSW11_IV]EQC45749.1 hypothetical protein M899_1382 [Bacteriovorax sp. BSW11_IV]
MKTKSLAILGTFLTFINVHALEYNEAHKFFCGLETKEYRGLNLGVCSVDKANNEESTQDDLANDVDKIINKVQVMSVGDYCKAINTKTHTIVSDISPLPSNECICELKSNRSRKEICTDGILDEYKDQINKRLKDNFDVYNKNAIISLMSFKDAQCDLSEFEYCGEQFKDKIIRSNFTEDKLEQEYYGKDIQSKKEDSLQRIENVLKNHDSFSDFILANTDGQTPYRNEIITSICDVKTSYPLEVRQLLFDVAANFPEIDLRCKNSDEIAAKSALIQTIMDKLFKSKSLAQAKPTIPSKNRLCSEITAKLSFSCNPTSEIGNKMHFYLNAENEFTVADRDFKENIKKLSCLYPENNKAITTSAEVEIFTPDVTQTEIVISHNSNEEKEAEDIISKAKDIIDSGNLSENDKARIKTIETKLKKMYGNSINLFADSKKDLLDKVKASIYKKEIKRKQDEIARLNKELNTNPNLTSKDRFNINKKISSLSKKKSRDDFFSSKGKSSYEPNYNTTPGSTAEAKFSFPSYDLNTPEFRENNQVADSNVNQEQMIDQSNVKNERTSASVKQGQTQKSAEAATSSKAASGTIGSSTSISGPSLISLDSYNSVKNYNVPNRKLENEALYDGQDPEVKAVFLQDEKLMRLFRYKDDKYELEEEFDARKFYANINQFDNKTKELGVVFFKRYAVNDLNTILKNN